MSVRTHVIAFVTLGCLIAATSSVAAAPAPLTVTSTMDGKKVLPPYLHWIATPNVKPARIKEVDFLIDGKLRWVEHKVPYTYGSDDNHGHLGYLFTSWLTPGKHRFTAVVVTTAGEKASDAVSARVLPAAAPPAQLAGQWTRTVSSADVSKSTSPPGQRPPTGVWKLVIDKVGAWMLDPKGSGIVQADQVTGHTLHVLAPIQMAPCSDNGPCGISRFGHHGISGTACREDGPFDSFTWSVTGTQLTLAATRAPCGDNRAILEGTWARAGG